MAKQTDANVFRALQLADGTEALLRAADGGDLPALMQLQRAYKAAIREPAPETEALERLHSALRRGEIEFYVCEISGALVGMCSVCRTFSTFDYRASGVFEDFYIVPEYRHKGLARKLVRFAHAQSGVSTMQVGCADCDVPLYTALGFNVPIGNLLAYDAPDAVQTNSPS